MEHYTLQADEVVLYQSTCNNTSEIILTNLNLILITKTKQLFASEKIETQSAPISTIKIYNNLPHIKQLGETVEIYFVDGETKLVLPSKSAAKKLTTAILDLVTGTTAAVRNAEKVKSAIGLADDTLGISTVDTAINAVERGLGGAITKLFKVKNGKNILSATQGLISKKEAQSVLPEKTSADKQVEELTKLKGLLDSGIITQEEFDKKKKEVLGL